MIRKTPNKKESVRVVIRNQYGVALFSDWKSACEAMEWNWRASSAPPSKTGMYKGYILEAVDLNVTIQCKMLRGYLNEGFKQYNNYIAGVSALPKEIEFEIGLSCHFKVLTIVVSGAVTEILKVTNWKGENVKIDDGTKELLIKNLEL